MSLLENQGSEGGFFRRDVARCGLNSGGFGNWGESRDEQARSGPTWGDSTSSDKREDYYKGWGDVGPHTGVLRSEDRGSCFRCRQTGHHQTRCNNPPMRYKCKKSGHLATSCPVEKKYQGLKPFGFGILGQGFYSLQVPGLQLSEQQATTG